MSIMIEHRLTFAEMRMMQMIYYGYELVTDPVNQMAKSIDIFSWVEGDGTVQAPFSSPQYGDRIVFRVSG